MLDTILPVASLLIGGGIGYFADASRDNRQRKGALDALNATRRQARDDRQEAFELDVLTRLLAALRRFGHAQQRRWWDDQDAAELGEIYEFRAMKACGRGRGPHRGGGRERTRRACP
ncbi:hypothetical protein AB0J74_20515 [Asanoa sp. NPDC049573]|uniref:hypothetical protein n=1 Tax=Asanoa sp. NPDC049573 TaxID=3155396 RepID=UPI003433A3C7